MHRFLVVIAVCAVVLTAVVVLREVHTRPIATRLRRRSSAAR